MEHSHRASGKAAVLTAVVLVFLLSGCAVSTAKPATPPTPTRVPVVHHHQGSPRPVVRRGRHASLKLMPDYAVFVNSLCHALAARNGTALEDKLEDYEYNSGVYWGTFNLAEGQAAQPSILGQWLSSGAERCVRFAPSYAGHGALATQGWTLDGGWALLDLDKINGSWKIDDFTFGGRRRVMQAFYGTEPVSVAYAGRA